MIDFKNNSSGDYSEGGGDYSGKPYYSDERS